MVVQSGRLKEKDKLSSAELIEAVRFGADKVFKSKDSEITNDDIDMILAVGKQKTQELNDKLQEAEKGDMLDFKLDGSMKTQTFEGVDYSQRDMEAIKAAQAEAELLAIVDMGKRERRTVAYNENQLYQQQIAAMGVAPKERKKRKELRLPRFLRLPKLEEWQMFDRDALNALQDKEEAAFKALPEEIQLQASGKAVEKTEEESAKDDSEKKEGEEKKDESSPADADANGAKSSDGKSPSKKKKGIDLSGLPPLLNEENLAEKNRLLAEGYVDWGRHHYQAFVKASAKYGRTNYSKIAAEVGKPESAIESYSKSFFDEDFGKKRFSEHEYDRTLKVIERGEKKLQDVKALQRGTEVFLSLFDNPWHELEFTYVNCKDKVFTLQEDRFLLCWAHKVSSFFFVFMSPHRLW